MCKKITILFLFLSFLGNLSSQNRYVSKTGNDTNLGTKDSSYLTIVKGLTVVGYMDTLIIGVGVYDECVEYLSFGLGGRQVILRKSYSVNSKPTVRIIITGGDFRMQTGTPAINTGAAIALTTESIGDPLMSTQFPDPCWPLPISYLNVKRNSTVVKNNCPTGYSGSSVTYVVPAGKYGSTISQLDADNKAWAEVLANRQTYANTNGTCAPTTIFYNVKRNSTVVKNNCPVGYKGSSVTYVVAAGKYSSTVSQLDADNKAWAEVLANRQTYANTNGTCSKL